MQSVKKKFFDATRLASVSFCKKKTLMESTFGSLKPGRSTQKILEESDNTAW